MPSQSVSVGVDLGTSNCALVYGNAAPQILAILQQQSATELVHRPLLPSLLFLNEEGEAAASLLPWGAAQPYILGPWARSRSLELPDRVVHSAKSWLSNPKYALAPLLPWDPERGPHEGGLSPYEASLAYLQHLRAALLHSEPELDLAHSNLVLTVPASFEEGARQLTLRAAESLGFERCALLEEPLAAVYAWIDSHEDTWRELLPAGSRLLVCDVGAGTCDFSLVAVHENADGTLALEREAVGEHLLLGGDNMDLALAYALQDQLEAEGQLLDHWQFQALLQQCREGKEALYADPTRSFVPLTLLKRGGSLFKAQVRCELTRAHLQDVLEEGFFAATSLDAPTLQSAEPLSEVGLRYAQDANILRQLARFLRRCSAPTHLLFNGGVFQVAAFRDRVCTQLQTWYPESQLQVLDAVELDLAVAKGAQVYARLQASGQGLRIAAGSARSFYLALSAAGPAVPGRAPRLRGLCVLPQGTREGTALPPLERPFALRTGAESSFRLLSSLERTDVSGALVDAAELQESAQLRVKLGEQAEEEWVSVRLRASVSEAGTLQLAFCHTESAQEWALEFNVKGV